MSNLAVDRLLEKNLQTYIEVQNAFDECSPEIREVIDDMLEICRDPEADSDEKSRAMSTIIEALFPSLAADHRQLERECLASPDAVEFERQLDEEEAAFADNVRRIMESKNITQTVLAERANVSQPAISNILTRQCRPQKRTVLRLATALDVSPDELWPGFSEPSNDS